MSHIGKAKANALAGIENPVIGVTDEELDRLHGVFHGINGFVAFAVHFSLGFFISPLRLHCLDVRRITEHDVAQAGRRFRGKNLSPEAIMIELGKHARVIDVRMGQKHEINLRSRNRKLDIFEAIDALLHAAVH